MSDKQLILSIRNGNVNNEDYNFGIDASNVFLEKKDDGVESYETLQDKIDLLNKSMRLDDRSGSAVGVRSIAYGYSTIASGAESFASGYKTKATGARSFSAGSGTQATGENSFACGEFAAAIGDYSHAEGYQTTAQGEGSHTEGRLTHALGFYSHAEGCETMARGNYSHVEGYQTSAQGEGSHTEGYKTLAEGTYSHAEGYQTNAPGAYSHAEGCQTKSPGNNSHAEGDQTTAQGTTSHAEGYRTLAEGDCSHAEGYQTIAIGNDSHAEGYKTTAQGYYSHAEGWQTMTQGNNSHAEGSRTLAEGATSHAEGDGTLAEGNNSHAEGYQTIAIGEGSHAEGRSNEIEGIASHIEGELNRGYSGKYCHIEGYNNNIRYGNDAIHIEGIGHETIQNLDELPLTFNSLNPIKYLTPERIHWDTSRIWPIQETIDDRLYSYQISSEEILNNGYYGDIIPSTQENPVFYRGTLEKGSDVYNNSILMFEKTDTGFVFWLKTIKEVEDYQVNNYFIYLTEIGQVEKEGYGFLESATHVQGKYSKLNNAYAHIVGGGSSADDRKNIHTLDWNGNAMFTGDIEFRGYSISDGETYLDNISLSEKLLELENRLRALENK